MYAVPVDVLRLYIWVWLVSLVCIIKFYPMLVRIKPFVYSCYNYKTLDVSGLLWYYDLH